MKQNQQKNKALVKPTIDPEQVEIRYTEPEDGKFLREWFSEPDVGRWFPLNDEVEIDDAVVRWISFCRYRCSLTAVINGVPVGMATLYLQPYKKLAHQCEFGIIVGGHSRNRGLGKMLLKNLIHLAKEYFRIELLHLQIYDENPAIHLYRQFEFREFGRQTNWIKETDSGYRSRVFMERRL